MRTKLVTIDPEIMSGEPVFTGTRVPVKNLIDHLREGDTLETFLEGFPSVKRSQAVAFLEQANASILEYYRQRMSSQSLREHSLGRMFRLEAGTRT